MRSTDELFLLAQKAPKRKAGESFTAWRIRNQANGIPSNYAEAYAVYLMVPVEEA